MAPLKIAPISYHLTGICIFAIGIKTICSRILIWFSSAQWTTAGKSRVVDWLSMEGPISIDAPYAPPFGRYSIHPIGKSSFWAHRNRSGQPCKFWTICQLQIYQYWNAIDVNSICTVFSITLLSVPTNYKLYFYEVDRIIKWEDWMDCLRSEFLFQL